MVEAKLILGLMGDVTCMFMFLSPVPMFWDIIKNKSTQHFSGLPCVMTLFSCLLWVFYGTRTVTNGDKLITIINGVGVGLGVVFVTLYTTYTHRKNKKKFVGFVAATMLVFLLIVLIVLFAVKYKMRKLVVGIFCVITNMARYGVPLSVMKRVIRTKSVAFMPFWLSLFMFLNTSVWMCFGIVSKDIFIAVSNGVGTGFGIAQLTLYAIFGCNKASMDMEVPLQAKVSQPQQVGVDVVVSPEGEGLATATQEAKCTAKPRSATVHTT